MRQVVWTTAAIGVLAALGVSSTLTSCRHPIASLVSVAPVTEYRTATPIDAAVTIYDGKLGDGWQDWGWGPHEIKDGQPARIDFSGFGGIILHHDELHETYGGVSFRYKTSSDYGDFLVVSLQYRQVDESVLPGVPVTQAHTALLPDGWKEVFIPWSEINPSGSAFDRVQIHARASVPSDLVSVDKLVLAKTSSGSVPTRVPTASRAVKVSIDCSRPATRISPLIYGIAANTWTILPPARRLGGNPLSRSNWDIGADNTASDWFFENVPAAKPSAEIAEDLKHNVKTALVVPTIGWVAKDTTSVGFPVSKFGPQHGRDQYRPGAGDGLRADGKPIPPGPPTETSIPASPELIRQWVENLVTEDRARGKRGVDMYILDNEPTLWNKTHRDVHPAPVTYDELLDRSIQYGSAIRRADSDAVIAGPAEWGWTGYFFSAKDTEDNHSDQRAHDGIPLLPWYLRKLAEYEHRTGTRILDVLDVHYYPQAENIYGSGARTDAAGAALRIRSTRSLWDPEYVDESWIADKVNLIPRLKEWVSKNYPGRGISIGEWSFGAEKHISGGLAIAESLGRFGKLGLYSAFYWFGPPPGTPGHVGFSAYLNYDGKGARFLDWSLPTSEEKGVSAFASRDQSGEHVTLVLLNLDATTAVQADVDVGTCGKVASERAFTYDGTTPGFVQTRVTPGSVSPALAPYSMNVVELTLAKAAPK
jgi:hypothetical protein